MNGKLLIINIHKIRIWRLKTPAIVGFAIIFNVLLTAFPQNLYGQKAGYHKVLDQSDRISGTFGEVRPNHFHAGTDYKTGEKEGLPVYAAAEGYISRVKVSSVGYGKVLYINHPDSTTTVYAHLRKFYGSIEDTLYQLQCEKMEFEQEIFPKPGEFPVQGDQLIGYSGNTGGSEGPHLHFEIRNTLTEKPFDPRVFGYVFTDTIAPVIPSIVIYKPGPFNGLYGSTKTYIPVNNHGGDSIYDTIKCPAEFFIGFESHDLAGSEINELGIQAFRLFHDDSLLFSSEINEFSFDETRQVNACFDYPFKQKEGKTIILCTRLPGNELEFFGKQSGRIRLDVNQISSFRLEVDDGSGNTRILSFTLKHEPEITVEFEETGLPEYTYGKALIIEEKDFRITFPEKAFYENLRIKYSSSTGAVNGDTSTLLLVDAFDHPVNKPISISIKPTIMKKEHESKMLLAKVDSSGKISGIGGKFAEGWVTVNTRSLGRFTVAIDTLGPEAFEPAWRLDDLTQTDLLVIPVKDNLSGLSKYRCFINDGWVCGEYNASRNEIHIYFENEQLTVLPLNLRIQVTDQKENATEWQFQVTK